MPIFYITEGDMVVNKETLIALIITVFMYTFIFITANYTFGSVSNKMNGLSLGIGIGCGILWRLYYRKTHKSQKR